MAMRIEKSGHDLDLRRRHHPQKVSRQLPARVPELQPNDQLFALRENIVRTSTPPDPSDAFTDPRKLDDLDALGPIYTPRIRLRALWTAWSVVVRVHSGAS
jgi:hypothetical protein